mgnify:CR=1 FL=1
MATAVAARYARALAEIAFDARRGLDPQAIAGDLAQFGAALAQSPDLRNVLLSPAVAPGRKRAVVERLAAAAGISPVTRNFLFVVIDHRRTGLFGDIQEAYRAEMNERLGLVEAGVTTAREQRASRQELVREGLERLTGKHVRPRFKTDERLIGGITVRIGSTIYDGSVRGQLDALRRKLTD